MPRTWQDVYASNLLREQHFGYPLRNPRPTDASDSEGLRVGDIGHVDENGTFILAFNISSPPKELQGEIPGAPLPQFFLKEMFSRESVFKAGAKQILGEPRYRHITVDEPQFLRGRIQRADYGFRMTASEGAILILPDGCAQSGLEPGKELEELRMHVNKYALQICRWIKRDTLCLVTEVYKSKSWTLGSFYGGHRGGEILVHRRSSHSTGTFTYHWESDVNMDCQMGPENNDYLNQTVLMNGFKITMRAYLLPIVEWAEWSQPRFAHVLGRMTSNLLRHHWVTQTGKPYSNVMKPSSIQIVHSCGFYPVSARSSIPGFT